MKKATKDYFELANSYGFTLARIGKHAIFKNKNGATVVCSTTPSDSRRGIMQFKKDIKAALTRQSSA